MRVKRSIGFQLGEKLAVLYLLGLACGLLIGWVCCFVVDLGLDYLIYILICLVMIVLAMIIGRWYILEMVVPLLYKWKKGERR